MGITVWSLAFAVLGVAAAAGLFFLENPVLAVLTASAIALWRAKAANDARTAALQARVVAHVDTAVRSETITAQELLDRTSTIDHRWNVE